MNLCTHQHRFIRTGATSIDGRNFTRYRTSYTSSITPASKNEGSWRRARRKMQSKTKWCLFFTEFYEFRGKNIAECCCETLLGNRILVSSNIYVSIVDMLYISQYTTCIPRYVYQRLGKNTCVCGRGKEPERKRKGAQSSMVTVATAQPHAGPGGRIIRGGGAVYRITSTWGVELARVESISFPPRIAYTLDSASPLRSSLSLSLSLPLNPSQIFDKAMGSTRREPQGSLRLNFSPHLLPHTPAPATASLWNRAYNSRSSPKEAKQSRLRRNHRAVRAIHCPHACIQIPYIYTHDFPSSSILILLLFLPIFSFVR